MISFFSARRIVLKHAVGSFFQKVALVESFGRTLAEDVRANADSPAFDRSLMDGFAFKSEETMSTPACFRIVETIPAGKRPQHHLKKGECAKISTGAMLPCGAECVVKKEDAVEFNQGQVRILKKVRRGENVLRKASFFKKYRTILKKGTPLNAGAVGLLASQGISEVNIFGSPRVAVLSTGNEVAELKTKKTNVQVWNATAPLLLSCLDSMAVQARYLGKVSDNPEFLLKKITDGIKYDILIITGAVSIGDFDFVPDVLKRANVAPIFHKVAMKPGKPVYFGRHDRCLVFGLPGNPVSSLVSFFLFVVPALKKMLGKNVDFVSENGILSDQVENEAGRLAFLPAQLKPYQGKNYIHPLSYGGSADLKAMAEADVLFMVDSDKAVLAKGSRVKFIKIV